MANTASTKSNRKVTQHEKSGGPQAPYPRSKDSFELSDRAWFIGVVSILFVAAFLRCYELGLVPLHHDEGVNGNFLVRLVRDGFYQYDPANYHGPTLYYFAAAFPSLVKLLFGAAASDKYGLTTFGIRFVPAFFGVATVGLILTLRRRLGTLASLAAAIFLTLSPGAVYLSRYFIHETHFVFFTLAIVVCVLRFYDELRPGYLVMAFASAALLFATKETAMISAGVLAIAFVVAHAYLRFYRTAMSSGKTRKAGLENSGISKFIEQLGGLQKLALWVGVGVIVFVVINIVFYSSFFTNYPKGIYDSLQTFKFWSKTGKEAHVHPLFTYVTWLFAQEGPILLLGCVGAAFAVLKPKNTVGLFVALWSFGLIAAYSLVPYKTPWLALNFIIPLAITAGYAVQSIYEVDMNQLRLPIVVMFAAIAINVYQMIDLNFVNYDNDDSYYVYVYAHTKRGTNQIVEAIDKIAADTHEDGKMGITIVSPDYWPLPWYLRNYSRVGYFGRMTQTAETVIIASEAERAEMESTFGRDYVQVPSTEPNGSFSLRPGVDLLLYRRVGPH